MKKYISIVIILLFTISCQNEIPFDIDKNPPKLIVNTLFDAGKDENEIVLAFTGRDEVTYINREAVIDIYVNGILEDKITKTGSDYPNETDYYIYKTGVSFAPGDVIRIEARTNDGKHDVWSEEVVPQPITIEKLDTATYIAKSDLYSSDRFLRVKTTFTDNGKKSNYYRIAMDIDFKIELQDSFSLEKTIVSETVSEALIIREDVVLTDGRPSTQDEEDNGILTPVQNYYGVFDNSRINGTYTMTTGMRIPYYYWGSYQYADKYITDIEGNLRVRLLSISKMEYFYLKALNTYDSVEYDDFITPPIKFPSNIEGGTGIFGISIGDETIIPLGKYVFKR